MNLIQALAEAAAERIHTPATLRPAPSACEYLRTQYQHGNP